jgi:glucose-1-phosphate adenylyltransferase
MGNYLFTASVLAEIVDGGSRRKEWHDFGKDILPKIHRRHRLFAYDFNRNGIPGMLEGEVNSYWRDVGTIEAYYEANMELRSVSPPLNLYNDLWPIITCDKPAPPVKFVFDDDNRRGCAVDSIVSGGSILSGGKASGSILGENVRLNSFSSVTDSILMEGVEIGRNCRVRRAIIDKNVTLPPGTSVGYDAAEDGKRFFVSPGGIVVIPRSPSLLSLGDMHR